jgi:CheY-like chemotaxis protein
MVQLSQRIQGLLAGRKLLLADDSVTIQKVIELTFADEGVGVVAFSNGQDAIDKLEEEAPDIVLADVFMPSKNVMRFASTSNKTRSLSIFR